MWPDCAFLNSVIDVASAAKELDHWGNLNAEAKVDLAWWYAFLQAWNGVNLILSQTPSILIASNASRNWGCGAIHGNALFQLKWPQSWEEVSIAPKELVPIIVAVGLWRVQWSGTTICCLCDNAAVVAKINKGSPHDPFLVRLLCILPFSESATPFRDSKCICRCFVMRYFTIILAHNPRASPIPAIIPMELGELALNKSLLWISPSWMRLFSTTLTELCLPLARHISQPNSTMLLSVPVLEPRSHFPEGR